MTPTQTGDKPMVTQRAIELLERAHAKGGLGYEAHGAIEYAINVLRHRAQETLSPEQPRPCAVCGDGLTTQMGASLKSKAESAATWMRRAATAEIELIQAREGLQKIATGGIDGEPSNYRDTLHIVRQIATDTLATLSPASPEASPSLGMGEAHGDRKCDACHRDNPVWFAPSPLWNLVIGGPEATDDPGGVLCPICFIEKAEAAGIMPATGAWLVTKEPAASLSPPSPDLAEENERLREALEAVQLSGIHRDIKWAGMNAHDIARATLQSISTGNP